MKMPCLGLECSECCKRYWITLIPLEAKRISEAIALSEKEFVEKKCLLVCHLYGKQSAGNGPAISSGRLPARIAEFAGSCQGLPPYFLALPSVALKRNKKGECVFLKHGSCQIHSVSPGICRLFPFISLDKRPLWESYPFCAALQRKGFDGLVGSLDEKQRKRVHKYFDAIERKGFLSQWRHLPGKGIVLLENQKELAVSKKEFLQLIQTLL